MLFNSFEFLVFLPIFFILYWWVFDYLIKENKHQLLFQNLLVVAASYLFYGWWNWRFLLLIAFTSFCSFFSGMAIEKSPTKKLKSFWMILNVVVNLSILGVYKYYDFFVSSLANALNINAETHLLHLVLPVGISFYTFQALSYSIDVYRRKIEATRDIVSFFAFLSFFPQLVAGPIERATNLLPQFLKKRSFNYENAVDGLRQMLWGMFKKVVVADNCAVFVDTIYSNVEGYNASTLAIAAILFSFQIYCDFSGYSDIAIGLGKLFGIKLMRNFNVPYFSRDIAEFWRRWHISLTTWFRDYVYIPLGGSRPTNSQGLALGGLNKKIIIVRNTFIIFLLSGFWHGANWTFVLWGAFHALLFLPLILLEKNRKYTNVVAQGRSLPSVKEFLQIVFTFILATLGWIIFRADNLDVVICYFNRLCDLSLWGIPYLTNKVFIFIPLFIMICLEWIHRSSLHGLSLEMVKNRFARYLIYFLLAFLILINMGPEQSFIYFQF